jgi:hypothetical protein
MVSNFDHLHFRWFNFYLDHFSKRIQIWIKKHKILTVALNMARSMMVAEMRVEWPLPNGMVWLVSRLVFFRRIYVWTEKCEIRAISPNIAKSVMVAEMRVRWTPLNEMVWLVSRPFFEESIYLDREMQNSHVTPAQTLPHPPVYKL